MYFLHVNSTQLEVKHLPVLLTCSWKLCKKPIHVPRYIEFHHNTSCIQNIRTFLLLIFQDSSTIGEFTFQFKLAVFWDMSSDTSSILYAKNLCF